MLKELNPILLLIISIILITALLFFGVLHISIKSIYETLQLKFWRGPLHFIKYWIKFLYQIWNVIKHLSIQIAISIDLFGNVICGEAIEDLVTTKENTLYGNGEITISEATGELESTGNLNKLGQKFSKILSKTLGKNHCIEAYKKGIYIKEFKL